MANSSLEEQIDTWRQELLGYLVEVKGYRNVALSEVYLRLAAYSARASEIRMRIVRSTDRRVQAFRTQEVDPFIAELERQKNFYGKFQDIRKIEWEMSQKGQ